MDWTYESLMQEHQLLYKKSVLARIQLNPTRKGKYRVTSLISGIYYGQKKMEYLERRNREWVAYRKTYSDKSSALDYIRRKKQEISRFIAAREKEL